jgi:DNA-binding response OmpR family regulator
MVGLGLAQEGYQVTVASDKETADKALNAAKFDLVVMMDPETPFSENFIP